MPIHHTTILVSNLLASKHFYTNLLAPLGYKLGIEFPGVVGFLCEKNGRMDFWIRESGGKEVVGLHCAFEGGDEGEVDGFWGEGVKAGGEDNGKPGLRPQFAENYYASFVRDLDGNNVECVFFK